MLTTEHFELERLSDSDYRLRWQPRADLAIAAITAGTTPDTLNRSARIDNTEGYADISDLAPAARHFFLVRFQTGAEILLAERRVALDGAPNFRDFGGYTTRDNQRVRWGVLYRSGHLHELTERDLEITAALDIGLICDFREIAEGLRTPNRFSSSYKPRIENLPITPGNASNIFSLRDSSKANDTEAMARVMIAINRDLALNQTEPYRKLFELILEHNSEGDNKNRGLLIHCAAGKDRTGFGAALILAALGVPEETLMHDYLLTKKYFPVERELDVVRKKYNVDLPDAAMRPVLEVREEYLRGALQAVHDEFGSIDNYLREALQIDTAMQRELRNRLLAH